MGATDPFMELRVAFDRAAEGRWLCAGVAFRAAMSAFDGMLACPETLARLGSIAAQIYGFGGRAEDICREFLDHLPAWLCEMHFEHFKREVSDRRPAAAVAHWQALAFGSRLPNLCAAIDLRNLRDLVCQHFALTSEVLASSEEAAAEGAQRAERILKADPENTAVRYSSIEGYARLMKIVLDRIMPRQKGELPGLQVTAVQRRRAEIALRRSVPRLRAHLSRAARAQDVHTPIAIFGYRQLGRYFITTGDLPMAVRMSRRARRLAPDDKELAGWARSLRRMGRSR